MNQTETATKPEELERQLEDFPTDWKTRVDAFAASHLGLKAKPHVNGDPVLERSDGYVARVGQRNKTYLFASTNRRIPSLDAVEDMKVDAAELIKLLVKFANGIEV